MQILHHRILDYSRCIPSVIYAWNTWVELVRTDRTLIGYSISSRASLSTTEYFGIRGLWRSLFRQNTSIIRIHVDRSISVSYADANKYSTARITTLYMSFFVRSNWRKSNTLLLWLMWILRKHVLKLFVQLKNLVEVFYSHCLLVCTNWLNV